MIEAARSTLALIVVTCVFGTGCLNFEDARTRFCKKATPEQRREICATSTEGTVWVSVKYGSYTPACVRVSASDSLGHLAEADIPRSAIEKPESREITLAVFRQSDWERSLVMQVTSYEASASTRCSGNELERHRASKPIEVTPGEVVDFNVTLLAQDEDHDDYARRTEEVAGTDCDDTLASVHPGQPEVCTGAVDADCDGKAACADTECLDQVCDDHNPCTLNDLCTAGANSTVECVGTPKTCQPPNLICYTGESACNPATGECVFTQQPATQPCDDNNACTVSDQCGADASCHGSASVRCDNPPSTCHQSQGICDPAKGSCTYGFKDSSASCDDSNACTQNDRCNGAGACAGELLPPCVPSDACHRSVRNCPTSATCVESVDPTKVNQPCTIASRNGVCRNDGVCSSFPYIPSNFDPDAIAETDRMLDVHITCGTPTDPVIFDSGTFGGSAPAGCSFPQMPTPRVIGDYTVMPIRNLTIDAGKALKLRGSRPVILAVYGNATLSGALLADADMDVPGAGGNRTNCGTQAGGTGGFASGEGSGGGGGGFGTAGAAGGRNDANTAGGTGGTAGVSMLVPLVGGCPGGIGGGINGGAGGAGGGALQVAVAGKLQVDNWVSVSGGGSRGGKGSTGNAPAGGGGGSGGGLVLEAFQLELTAQARITANGGSGAEGGDSTQPTTGSDGADGSISTRDAAHCADTGGIGAPGGDGGADNKAPVTPNDGFNNSGGGGGGGAVGIIRIRGFGSCTVHSSCNATDGANCEISPKVTPTCPP
ncbi:putative metal-binding motif-containing protein [Hyalangium versicolor]|uniref:putative metal-binding motif-containing protein n=1 Tax=Hyalangium versicolor TaxID=2861190 RepID=UPI00272AD7D1|nr:putative metal-binding motif-containing protein [Hyalangium versicolor]